VAFTAEGYRVTSFGDGEEFKAIARSRTPPACVILDVLLPARSGLDILKDVDAPSYAAPFIVLSGIAGVPAAVEAIKNGAFDFIEKPFTRGAISERVREIIGAWTRLHSTESNTELWSARLPGRHPLTRREAGVAILSVQTRPVPSLQAKQSPAGIGAKSQGHCCASLARTVEGRPEH